MQILARATQGILIKENRVRSLRNCNVRPVSNSVLEHCLKGLFHPAFLARVVSGLAFAIAIFMGHENVATKRPTKRRHVQGMLDERDSLRLLLSTLTV